MILALLERPSMEDTLKKALSDVEEFSNEEIETIGIGGHVYTEDEKSVLCPSEKVKQEAEDISKLVGEKALLFGKEYVLKNVARIKAFINQNPITTLINACDGDKNGDYLFEYVCHQIEPDIPAKVKRLIFFSITKEGTFPYYEIKEIK